MQTIGHDKPHDIGSIVPALAQNVQSHDILYTVSRDILYTPGACVSTRGGATGMAWKTMDVQEQRVRFVVEGGWDSLLVLLAPTIKWVPRSCVLCKGGHHGRRQ